MWSAGLSAVAFKLDGVTVDLGPSQLGDFLSSCARKNEQTCRGAEWSLSSTPHLRKLVIAQHPIAALAVSDSWHSRRGVRLENVSLDTPAKEAAHICLDAPRHDRGTTVGNAIEQVVNVALSDLITALATPCGQQVNFERAVYLLLR